MQAVESGSVRVLVVDDDPLVRYSLSEMLSIEGYPVTAVEDGQAALASFENTPWDLIFTDIRMPGLGGIELLKAIKDKNPETTVILITGYGSIEEAVAGMKLGATEYITKPIDENRVMVILERENEKKRLSLENQELRRRLAEEFQFENVVAIDPQMRKTLDLISVVADTEATILISGESGTGKSTIARAIHYNSSRRDLPLVEISCGALSENLLESELFGHVRGAFTGAVTDKIGRLERAKDGTVFLDEIDTLSLRLQVKLLRFLQDRKFEKVGGTDTIRSGVRVIAAANRDLTKCVEAGEFREDLFHRLNVVAIKLPPLRERLSDIPPLLDHFLEKYNKRNSKHVEGMSNEVMRRLLSHGWPGNVRELENTVERAVILCAGTHVTFDLLPPHLLAEAPVRTQQGLIKLDAAIERAENETLERTLRHFKGNRSKTADFLGINRTTLYQKMKKHGFLEGNFKA
jgi:DNA-binding NtrC family response regulator